MPQFVAKRLWDWRVFWAIAIMISAVDSWKLSHADLHTARGIMPQIVFTVQWALPWFLLAFSASSLAVLWRTRATRWMLARRRYLGLGFAYGMSWHLVLVSYSIVRFGSTLSSGVAVFDLVALAFLLALTVTSFRPVARRLSTRVWRRLHKTGVYVIWLLLTYIYAESVRVKADLVNVAAVTILLVAWGLRVGAWLQQRWTRRDASSAAAGESAPN